MKRILVTGSRKWVNVDAICAVLDGVLLTGGDPPVLVHGAADGADTIAAAYWASFGFPVEPHPPNYKRYNRKAAPHIRNAQMVHLGADHCYAFLLNDSPGTLSCIKLAKAASIPTTIYRETTCLTT